MATVVQGHNDLSGLAALMKMLKGDEVYTDPDWREKVGVLTDQYINRLKDDIKTPEHTIMRPGDPSYNVNAKGETGWLRSDATTMQTREEIPDEDYYPGYGGGIKHKLQLQDILDLDKDTGIGTINRIDQEWDTGKGKLPDNVTNTDELLSYLRGKREKEYTTKESVNTDEETALNMPVYGGKTKHTESPLYDVIPAVKYTSQEMEEKEKNLKEEFATKVEAERAGRSGHVQAPDINKMFFADEYSRRSRGGADPFKLMADESGYAYRISRHGVESLADPRDPTKKLTMREAISNAGLMANIAEIPVIRPKTDQQVTAKPGEKIYTDEAGNTFVRRDGKNIKVKVK